MSKKRVFKSGAVRDSDENKESYVESMSFLAMRRYAFYMKSKQTRYGKGNWRKGIPIESSEDSFLRHMQKYFANKYENANLEPDEDHLSAMRFNLDNMMHAEEVEKLESKKKVTFTVSSEKKKLYKRSVSIIKSKKK